MKLKKAILKTPLGNMIAVADEKALSVLAFENKAQNFITELGRTSIIDSIEKELNDYFDGKLTVFKTPLHFIGTDFQQATWRALQQIPFGETRSYAEMAQSIGKPTAFRALANANGANPLCIVVPCHRVIQSNGKLGGYTSGIENKKWLLAHERIRANFVYK